MLKGANACVCMDIQLLSQQMDNLLCDGTSSWHSQFLSVCPLHTLKQDYFDLLSFTEKKIFIWPLIWAQVTCIVNDKNKLNINGFAITSDSYLSHNIQMFFFKEDNKLRLKKRLYI